MELVTDFPSCAPKSLQIVTVATKLKDASWKKKYDKPRQCIKKQRNPIANNYLYSQSYGFSSSHVQRESWTIKNAECRRMDAFKLWCWRRLLSPLDSKEIKSVNPKGNQP